MNKEFIKANKKGFEIKPMEECYEEFWTKLRGNIKSNPDRVPILIESEWVPKSAYPSRFLIIDSFSTLTK